MHEGSHIFLPLDRFRGRNCVSKGLCNGENIFELQAPHSKLYIYRSILILKIGSLFYPFHRSSLRWKRKKTVSRKQSKVYHIIDLVDQVIVTDYSIISFLATRNRLNFSKSTEDESSITAVTTDLRFVSKRLLLCPKLVVGERALYMAVVRRTGCYVHFLLSIN